MAERLTRERIEEIRGDLPDASTAELKEICDMSLRTEAAEQERFQLREERFDAETQIACAADLLNTWCREIGVPEVERPYRELNLRSGIDRVYAKMSGDVHALRGERHALREELSRLRSCVVLTPEQAGQVRKSLENIRRGYDNSYVWMSDREWEQLTESITLLPTPQHPEKEQG